MTSANQNFEPYFPFFQINKSEEIKQAFQTINLTCSHKHRKTVEHFVNMDEPSFLSFMNVCYENGYILREQGIEITAMQTLSDKKLAFCDIINTVKFQIENKEQLENTCKGLYALLKEHIVKNKALVRDD